ncbi:VOC family protein [Salinispora arenicola]|uniref:Glyoxalase/bleomycin resistance protein/dioxygenase n=1 Tax=Salinispora arenicola (strain CNS-205) TaxID=391037 RepID=A8LYG6_SALAI|nr:VOC family protein [Salinispora arenicola]
MVLNHIGVHVRHFDASRVFYDAVLATLGGRRLLESPTQVGYGTNTPDFWLYPLNGADEGVEVHIAFTAPDRATVRAFHDAALAAGAEVLHAPRIWPEYHPNYFGAFVRDPDGNNVEAVCHEPE